MRKQKQKSRWSRFQAFVQWYMAQGGSPLTPEEIERTLLKF